MITAIEQKLLNAAAQNDIASIKSIMNELTTEEAAAVNLEVYKTAMNSISNFLKILRHAA
jgi:hypothetical protein